MEASLSHLARNHRAYPSEAILKNIIQHSLESTNRLVVDYHRKRVLPAKGGVPTTPSELICEGLRSL
jgi:hypothetical protein